jgi:hypothetical protein
VRVVVEEDEEDKEDEEEELTMKFKTAVDDNHEHANEEHDHQGTNKRKVDCKYNLQNTVGVQVEHVKLALCV